MAVVGAAIGGIGNGVVAIALQTAIQERTSDEWMALVMSLVEAVSSVAPGLGILSGGVLTAVFSPRVAFATAAVAALGFASCVPILMRSERAGPQPDPSDPTGSKLPDTTAGPARARPGSLV